MCEIAQSRNLRDYDLQLHPLSHEQMWRGIEPIAAWISSIIVVLMPHQAVFLML